MGYILLQDGSALLIQAPDGPLPRSLKAAIYRGWVDAGLAGSVGKLYAVSAGSSPPLPYVVFETDDSVMAVYSALGQIDRVRIGFTCRADTPEQAETMAQSVDSWIFADFPIGRKFAWASGTASPAVRGHRRDGVERETTVGNKRVYYTHIEYRIGVRGGI